MWVTLTPHGVTIIKSSLLHPGGHSKLLGFYIVYFFLRKFRTYSKTFIIFAAYSIGQREPRAAYCTQPIIVQLF